MDMGGVLLHEYGHALALEHSSDAGGFLVVTLQPGHCGASFSVLPGGRMGSSRFGRWTLSWNLTEAFHV